MEVQCRLFCFYVGFADHICHLHTYWRCIGRRQGFHGYVSAAYIAVSNEHVANVNHLPHHG